MKVGVVGAGYVGLVTSACLADRGHRVICADVDGEKIRKLNAGEMTVYEPGLEALIACNVEAGRLSFVSSTPAAAAGAAVVFLTVGTPAGNDGTTQLGALFEAVETVVESLTGPVVLVTKSTVPVGTARVLRNFVQPLAKHPIAIVSNPEFLKEGEAVNDFMKPDRIVIGCESEEARSVMQEIYEPFAQRERPILFVDLESAEMTKYAANAFLAMRVSFMNEISHLCDATGADIETVRQGMGFDRRIGGQFMFAGVGYGGSCLPRDLKALIAFGEQRSLALPLLHATDAINESQKGALVDVLKHRLGPSLVGKVVAVWGLAFKPGTDDIRDAPALAIIDGLLAAGAKVRATDPAALENTRRVYASRAGCAVAFSHDPYEALDGADALIVVTEWSDYRRPDFARMHSLMRTPLILDGRNIYDPAAVRGFGFSHFGVGRRGA